MSAHVSRAFGNDSDSDSDHHGKQSGVTEESLIGFSARGAEKARRSPPRAKAKVIPLRGDSDWVAERKRRLDLGRHAAELGSLTSMRAPGQLGAAPPTNGSSSAVVTASTRIGPEPAQVGLVIRKRERQAEAEQNDQDSIMAEVPTDRTPPASQTSSTPPPLDLEAEARAALLSGTTHASTSIGPQRIIRIDEEALIKADAASRPDAPTLDDYAATPVSEFGAALLRGMGWKEGQGAGRKRDGPTSAPLVKKRAALLGLGAKERKLEPESASNNKAGKQHFAKRPDTRYVPLIKRAPAGEQANSSVPSPAESRLASRAASPDREAYTRRDERQRERERERDRPGGSDREREYERRERRHDRERNYDERDRERRHYDERDRQRSSRHGEHERERSGRSYRESQRRNEESSESRNGDRNGGFEERDRERGSNSRRDHR